MFSRNVFDSTEDIDICKTYEKPFHNDVPVMRLNAFHTTMHHAMILKLFLSNGRRGLPLGCFCIFLATRNQAVQTSITTAADEHNK